MSTASAGYARSTLLTRRWVAIGTAASVLSLVVLLWGGLATSAVISHASPVPALTQGDARRAAFAGLAQYQVEWFGLGLAKRNLASPQGAFVVVVPVGQANPTAYPLDPTGSKFTSSGPQGHAWTSSKYTYGGSLEAWAVPVADVRTDPALGPYNYVLVFDALDLGGTQFDLYVDTDLGK